MTRFSPRRIVVLFRRTSLFDRIAILILALYVLSRLVRNATGYSLPLASFLGFLSIAAVGYWLCGSILLVRRKGLWRLRNRLIVAYIFMAVVPVVLILAGGLIAAILLELQIGAHLLRDDLHDHVTVIAADADAIAAALNREPDLKVDQPVSPESTAVEDPILSRPAVAKIIAAAQGGMAGAARVHQSRPATGALGQRPAVRRPRRVSRPALVRISGDAFSARRPRHAAGRRARHAGVAR